MNPRLLPQLEVMNVIARVIERTGNDEIRVVRQTLLIAIHELKRGDEEYAQEVMEEARKRILEILKTNFPRK